MDAPSHPDPYSILGLTPGATPEEIRLAYRRLAMRWHPDRNPDPMAPARFKEIRAAYDWLTGDGNDAETGEAGTSSGVATGDPRYEHVVLSLEEAARGTTREVVVTGRATCTACKGSGRRTYSRTTMCAGCFGSGRVRGSHGKLHRCPQCAGRGFVTEALCQACEGRGWNPAERTLKVQVPPGMLAGETLRVAGQGGPAPEGGQPGDLFLEIRFASHPLFRLDGRDLHVTVPVSLFRRLTGGHVVVPSLTGLRDVQLVANSPDNLRIAGAGFPRRGDRPAGDLVVHFRTIFPQSLDDQQLDHLRAADRLLEADLERQSPELAEWRRRLDDLDKHR